MTNRAAVVGHWLGAELALDYAASAAAAGLPVPTAVMSVVRWCHAAEGACLGVDLGTISATTGILMVTVAEDPAATAAVARIWAELRRRAAGQPGCGAAGHRSRGDT